MAIGIDLDEECSVILINSCLLVSAIAKFDTSLEKFF